MNTMIDLGDELLIDVSSIADPYIRLAAISFGQPLVKGSQWFALNKQLAVASGFLSERSSAPSIHSRPFFRKRFHGNVVKSSSEVLV